MNVKRIVALAIAAALLVFGVVASLLTSVVTTDFQEMFSEMNPDRPTTVIEEGDPNNQVAVINIEGQIVDMGTDTSPFSGITYNHDLTVSALKDIAEDDSFSAVILNVNSPGGGVYESSEIHEALSEVKESGKIIYSSMGKMAASGGYYVSAPADKIYATNETITGSIGVITSYVNFAELAEDLGIERITYKSGPNKDMFNSLEHPSEEVQEIHQEMVDDMFSRFVDVVSEGREMSTDRVRNLADGRVYLGSQAVENGLVDELGYFDDALEDLKEEVGGNPHVVEYGRNSGYLFDFNASAQNAMGNLFFNRDVAKIEAIIQQNNAPRPMYLYTE